MAYLDKKPSKKHGNEHFNTEIRNKLGVTQAQLAAILNVSRTYIALAETGRRTLHSRSNTLLTNIFLHFHELETGKQSSYRSIETNLFLNDEYKKVLPEMQRLEKELGTDLFERGEGHQIRLTARGQDFLNFAERVLQDYAALQENWHLQGQEAGLSQDGHS